MSGMTSTMGSSVLVSTSSNGVARRRTDTNGTRRRGVNAVETAETASSATAFHMSQHCTALSALHSKEQMNAHVQHFLQEQPAIARMRSCGKVVVLRAAPESVALGSGTNNVSTPSVAHGAPERPAERL